MAGIDILFNDLSSKEDDKRFNALTTIMEITESKVEWFDQKYEELIDKINDVNSYQRSIGLMVLCNLAKSDRHNKLSIHVEEIVKHIKDEKFITSRQCIQSIWKLAVINNENKAKIAKALSKRFIECEDENHANLIRLDIIGSLKKMNDEKNDVKIQNRIDELIGMEKNDKNRKQYLKVL
jgi:hypothetical protein